MALGEIRLSRRDGPHQMANPVGRSGVPRHVDLQVRAERETDDVGVPPLELSRGPAKCLTEVGWQSNGELILHKRISCMTS